mgnify:CR=1 FL=1
MERENLFNLYVEAYFGVREMDEYDLKEYVLKDIENYIKDFVYTNDIDINYAKENAERIKDEVNIPVKYIGLGEGENDLQSFDIEKYIYGLFKDL